MLGWLIVNGFLDSEKFVELYDMFKASSDKFNIDLKLKRNDQVLVDINTDKAVNSVSSTYPDFILFWDKDVKLAKYFEMIGIPVYNSAKSIAICDDKSLTHLELMNSGIKMPRTVFAPMTFSNVGYTNYRFIKKLVTILNFPLVIKEVFGSFGSQVYLANNEEELYDIVKKHSKAPLIFQKYIDTSKGKDIRLQVVGNKVIASMYRYNDTGDFRANLSNGGKMESHIPTKDQEELALKCCDILGLDFAGVDILFGENDEPILCEVNSNAHFKNITDITGVSVSDKIIEYILKDLVE